MDVEPVSPNVKSENLGFCRGPQVEGELLAPYEAAAEAPGGEPNGGEDDGDGEGQQLEDVQSQGEIDEEVEAEPCKIAPSPTLPSATEIEDHRTGGHIPYRSWCDHCNQRALGEQRGHHVKPERSDMSVIGIDYFYSTAKGRGP